MSDEKILSVTPYDDVFRTLLNDCSELIIPVINEMFGESYSGDEKIVFSPNEHFINRQDGVEDKRITDSSFMILGRMRKKYLYECQSVADSSLLIRLFEYGTQIGLDESELVNDTLEVEIPNCAVLFLRSTKSTPDKMYIKIKAPTGELSFDVHVLKTQQYTLDEIFEKNLLFLIPFYIFTHELNFKEYEADDEKLEKLKAEYAVIMTRLDELLNNKQITAYTRKTIIEMSNKVLEGLTVKYQNIREGVKAVMGGKVLEYEAKTILRQGEMKKAKEITLNLFKRGMEIEDIAKAVDVDINQVKEWLDLLIK